MANNKNLIIYEVFVRNHGPHGTFADVTADLPRIKLLGVDVVWLMPIHPIGRRRRKGGHGSPYAIADYRAVNPNYGTEADFAQLVETAHQLGLKVMIDVVFNHTAPDSVLARQHPDWFYQSDNGQPVPRFAEWSDVVDLRHGPPELTRSLIDSLLKWVQLGVDGFRCDVASLVPVDFWAQARAEVAALKPGFIWLAESVHLHFVRHMRRLGYLAHSDGELYRAFDITYDYDIHTDWQACVRGQISPADYVKMLHLQEAIYPQNFVKLRFVENHDQPRIAALAATPAQARNWTALAAFLPGAFLIYAGQESAAEHLPGLFDPDPIGWPAGKPPLSDFLSRLAALKKHPAAGGRFDISAHDSGFAAAWQHGADKLAGIFNVRGHAGGVPPAVDLPDGEYTNLLDDSPVAVEGGRIGLRPEPVIIAASPLRPEFGPAVADNR